MKDLNTGFSLFSMYVEYRQKAKDSGPLYPINTQKVGGKSNDGRAFRS